MSPDALILAQNAPKMRLAAGLRPDPLGSLQRSPRPPSWIQGVLLLAGGEGRRNAPNFVSRFGGIEVPDVACEVYDLSTKLKTKYITHDMYKSQLPNRNKLGP